MDVLFKKLDDLLKHSKDIVIVVANNPDADAVGSALALEEILGQLSKKINLYCQAEIPYYLRFLSGWDRFENQLPRQYDLAIMVDNSTPTLLQNPFEDILLKLKQKPLVILDHHPIALTVDYAQVYINQPQMVATGQLIYSIACQLKWPLNKVSANFLAHSILSDSLRFTSQNMINNSAPLRTMADLVDLGVNLSQLEQQRLTYKHLPASLVNYKGQLLSKIQFHHHDQIASLIITHQEIKACGSTYNPTIVLDEMNLIENVKISLGFKQYENRLGEIEKITVRIRCHHQSKIAQNLAQNFGGDGHPYAAGCKIEQKNLNFDDFFQQVIQYTQTLLDKENEPRDET